jgi:hypothetical protein
VLIEIHIAELLGPDPSSFEFEIAIADFKSFKSRSNYQIQAELLQAGGEMLGSDIHTLIKSLWNKEA